MFVLTTEFQHNYMVGFPIFSVLIRNEASMNASVVIRGNLTDGIKDCFIKDEHWEDKLHPPLHFYSLPGGNLFESTRAHTP